MVITGLTRNFTATWSFRPPEILDIKGFSKSKIEYFSVFSPAFLSKKIFELKADGNIRRCTQVVEGSALENLRPFGSFVRRKTLILLGFSNLKIE